MITIDTIRGALVLDDQWSGPLAAWDRRMASAGQTIDRFATRVQSVGLTLTPMSLAITAVGGAAIRASLDFERAMNQIQGVAQPTTRELEAVRKKAIEMGAATVFSATDAANAMLSLNKAGLSTGESMAGVDKVLQLAAASGLTMADAADMAARTISMFGLEVKDLERVNDVLAKAVNLSTLEINDLRVSLGYIGPIARSVGMSIEETAAALAIMRDNGVPAETTGRALREALERLLNPTKEVTATLQALGVNVHDAHGRLLPFSDIVQRLGPHAKDTAAMMKIFGSAAGPGMVALLSEGHGALTRLTTGLEQSKGAAKAMADAMMQGLPGAFEKLRGSVETAMLSISKAAEPALLPVLGLLERGADLITNDVVPAFTALPAPVQTTALALMGITAAAGPALLALGSMVHIGGLAATGASAVSKLGESVSRYIGTLQSQRAALAAVDAAQALYTTRTLSAEAATAKWGASHIAAIGATTRLAAATTPLIAAQQAVAVATTAAETATARWGPTSIAAIAAKQRLAAASATLAQAETAAGVATSQLSFVHRLAALDAAIASRAYAVVGGSALVMGGQVMVANAQTLVASAGARAAAIAHGVYTAAMNLAGNSAIVMGARVAALSLVQRAGAVATGTLTVATNALSVAYLGVTRVLLPLTLAFGAFQLGKWIEQTTGLATAVGTLTLKLLEQARIVPDGTAKWYSDARARTEQARATRDQAEAQRELQRAQQEAVRNRLTGDDLAKQVAIVKKEILELNAAGRMTPAVWRRVADELKALQAQGATLGPQLQFTVDSWGSASATTALNVRKLHDEMVRLKSGGNLADDAMRRIAESAQHLQKQGGKLTPELQSAVDWLFKTEGAGAAGARGLNTMSEAAKKLAADYAAMMSEARNAQSMFLFELDNQFFNAPTSDKTKKLRELMFGAMPTGTVAATAAMMNEEMRRQLFGLENTFIPGFNIGTPIAAAMAPKPGFMRTALSGMGATIKTELGPTILQALMGGGDVGRSIGGLVGGSFTNSIMSGTLGKTVSGALSGALGSTIGGAIGSVIPGLGTLLGSMAGPLISKIGGFFKGLFGGVSQKELEGREAVKKFEAQLHSLLNETQRLEAGGERWKMTVIGVRDAYLATGRSAADAERDVQALWNSSKHGAEAAERAAKRVNEAIQEQQADAARLDAAIQKYGFTLEQLGPAFRKGKLDEQAKELIEDWRVLVASGIDITLVNDKMSAAMSDYIDMARRSGTEVPIALKPILDTMVRQGDLQRKLSEDEQRALDGAKQRVSELEAAIAEAQSPELVEQLTRELNKQKNLVDELSNTSYSNLEDVGLTFSETMTQGFDRVVLKLEQLIRTLQGAGVEIENLPDSVTIDVQLRLRENQIEDYIQSVRDRNLFGNLENIVADRERERLLNDPDAEIPGFSHGTRGRYVDFGGGTPVELHGKERVVTEAEGRQEAATVQAAFAAVASDAGATGGGDVHLHFDGDIALHDVGTKDPMTLARELLGNAFTIIRRNDKINGEGARTTLQRYAAAPA